MRKKRIMGYRLLEGGAEFGGLMSEPDRRALALAGGLDARLSIIPAAAAPDNNHRRAGQNGVQWFESLGATNVAALPLIDRISANDPAVYEALGSSKIIYLLGGFPHYLGQTLNGSKSWSAMLAAYRGGAVIGGSSAGAMVLCDHYYDPTAGRVMKGLGLVPGVCIIPHHDSFGQRWASRLMQLLPDAILIGIDEETGMLDEDPRSRWRVYGKGMVTLYTRRKTSCYTSKETFTLEKWL